MAVQGLKTVDVTPYDYLRFTWNIHEQDINNNLSTVHWNLYLVSLGSGRINSSSQKAWSVTIDGTTYSGTNTVGIGNNETKLLASGAKMIWHNADGTKTFSYSFSQSFVGITWSGTNLGTYSGSGTGTLDTIPRAATITSAPNFTDSDNPTITYSNPAGKAVTALQACISWTGGDDIPYQDIPPTGTSYTFNLTNAQRAKLRAAVTSGTSIQVKFYVTTWFGNTPQYSTLTRTFTINNAHPTITSITAKDVHATTLALTGDENTWIKGYSDIEYAVAASPRQDATITKYEVTIGNQTKYTASGYISEPTTDILYATVTDSRGNSTSGSINATRFIDYSPLTCVIRDVKFEAEGNLSFIISGNYYNGSFGAANNTLRVDYRVWAEGSAYPSWITVEPTITNNGYSYSHTVTGLDYTQNYTIQARAFDSLIMGGIYTNEYKVAKVIPVFDWSDSDFNFNVPVNINGGLTVDGVPIGGGSSAPDYVIEQGFSGNWSYRKWYSGLCEMWGWCQPSYREPHYMGVYVAYPVSLTDWISANGTLNSFTGSLSTYLTTNVKVEPTLFGCNVWVQNSNNSFTEGQVCDVSIHIVGKWK